MVEVRHRGELLMEGTMCDACFDESINRFEELQTQYENLIASGVHPRMADRIMQQKAAQS